MHLQQKKHVIRNTIIQKLCLINYSVVVAPCQASATVNCRNVTVALLACIIKTLSQSRTFLYSYVYRHFGHDLRPVLHSTILQYSEATFVVISDIIFILWYFRPLQTALQLKLLKVGPFGPTL